MADELHEKWLTATDKKEALKERGEGEIA